MAILEIQFEVRISGYGGPKSPWALEYVYLRAWNKREADQFFQTLLRSPHGPQLSWGIMNRELGNYWRAKEVMLVDASKFTKGFSPFEPKVYSQAELTAMAADYDQRTKELMERLWKSA